MTRNIWLKGFVMTRNIWLMIAFCCALSACNESGRPVAATTPAPSVSTIAPGAGAPGTVNGSSYVVAPGDTLAVVAERTNTPLRLLIDLNGLKPPYRLQPGQRLTLQQRAAYIAQPGDTVYTVAQKLSVDQSALIALNGLKPPYALKPGQALTVPSEIESAPVGGVAQSAIASSGSGAAAGGGISTSALPPPGQKPTVEKNARAAKPVATPMPQAQGQQLEQPQQSARQAVTPLPVAAAPAAPEEPARQEAKAPEAAEQKKSATPTAASQIETQQNSVPQDPAPTNAATVNAAPTSTALGSVVKPVTVPRFAWPVAGKVIGKFGPAASGLHNDGINIAAPAGAPVRAAGAGIVAYAGNELRGFGNMVLIRHADGWVTAYAHNKSLLVQKGDQVTSGQIIARLGDTGNVTSPQLHFEIRKGSDAVDPMKYLGGSEGAQ